MRILWVEDFGKANPETLVGQLFSFASDRFVEVLGVTIMALRQHDVEGTEADWRVAYDEIGDTPYEIHPVVHESQFSMILKSGRLNEDFDLVLIDIDLTDGFFDKSPDHVTMGLEGQWVYQKLLQKGFLSERLAFLTANKDKVPEMSEQLRRLSFIEDVVAFGKNESQALNKWLQGQDEDYLRLRRGVLDGQQFARHLIEKAAYEPVFPPGNPFSRNDLHNYLDSIRVTFQNPKLPPADFTVLPKFLDRIVGLWERAQLGRNSSPIQKATHHTLKNVRNWCAHNRLAFVSPQDVALLYILNMRTVFDDQQGHFRCYEKVLMKLFRCEVEIPSKYVGNCITSAYRSAWNDYDSKVKLGETDYKGNCLSWEGERQNKTKYEYTSFNDISNQLVDSAIEGKITRQQLLAQCFWVVLGGWPKGKGNDARVVLNQPLAADWCQQLLVATIPHCFPGWDKALDNQA